MAQASKEKDGIFVNAFLGKMHNQTVDWDGTPRDCCEYFKKLQKKYGPDWYYYNKKINYKFNEHGFRTKTFEKIDMSKHVVIIGDSIVTGIGNAEEDTIWARLETALDMPVINLGVSASGIDSACINSLILHNNYPPPEAVVHLWSSLDRYSDFDDNFYNNQRWERVQPNNKHYYARHNWTIRNRFYIEADRTLWKGKTYYYEASFFTHTAKEIGVDLFDWVDYARDDDHPGAKSNKIAAECIAENLKKQGISA